MDHVIKKITELKYELDRRYDDATGDIQLCECMAVTIDALSDLEAAIEASAEYDSDCEISEYADERIMF